MVTREGKPPAWRRAANRTGVLRPARRLRRAFRQRLDTVRFLRRALAERDEVSRFLARRDALVSEGALYGSLRDDELPLLERLVGRAGSSAGPMVEIGTLFGLTTVMIATWKAPEQKVITVDDYSWNPWWLKPEQHFALTQRVLNHLVACGHVEQVRMDKDEFYGQYDGPAPALVFLDAVHEYEPTRDDIAWARAADASIICGHDYCEEFGGLRRAVDEAGGPRELAGSLWVLPSVVPRQDG